VKAPVASDGDGATGAPVTTAHEKCGRNMPPSFRDVQFLGRFFIERIAWQR
jgi:hypothetical protein